MKENFDKLPKWAKRRIEALTQNNNYLQKQLDEIASKIPSNVRIRAGLETKNLPFDSIIEFTLNKQPVSIMFRDERKYIEIQGWQQLQIHPRASNTFYISQDQD